MQITTQNVNEHGFGGFINSISRGAERFVQKAAPIANALNVTGSIYQGATGIGSMIFGAAQKPAQLMEFGDRIGVNKSKAAMQLLGGKLTDTPELFTPQDAQSAQGHIGTIESFYNAYSKPPALGGSRLTSTSELYGLKEMVAQHRKDFPAESVTNFPEFISNKIAFKNNLDLQRTLSSATQGNYPVGAAGVMREVDDAIASRILSSSDKSIGRYETAMQFRSLRDEFYKNVDKNTPESIDKSKTSLQAMANLVNKTGRGLEYTHEFNKMKYKYLVRSNKWKV